MLSRILLGVVVLIVPGALAHGQALPSPPADRLSLRSDGNELIAWRTAPVPFRSLAALSAALEHPLPTRSRAIRLVRTTPPESIEYFACVTAEGTLVFGEETVLRDAVAGPHRPARRGLTRAYPGLEYGGYWVWLVEVPLSRDTTITLEIRATTRGWPVRAVTIDLSNAQ